jgi:hypothetical protein
MKQVYLLPIFLGMAFSMGAVHTIAPVEKDENSDSFTVAVSSVALQDTIRNKQDTTKVAYVRDDDPKMKKKAPPVKKTRVTFKRDVQRASLSKQSAEGNMVDVILMQSGRVVRDVEDLQLVGNSGNPINSGNFIGFENMVIPFEGTVRFKSSNLMGTTMQDREVRFTLMEKGRWVLKIDL